MSWNKTIPFSEGLEQLRGEVREGTPAPDKPLRLPRSAIRMAHSVFQPRMFEGQMDASERQVATLKEAIANAKDRQLDPITVWWSGKYWRPIDGHHRLLAYERLAGDLKRPIVVDEIAVDVFEGPLGQAIAQAARLNSKDKLPMSKQDKIERAWKLVAARVEMSKAEIAGASGVSERLVAHMRKERDQIESREGVTIETALTDMTWKEILRGSREPTDHDDAWEERQAKDWARRLVKVFGAKPTRIPSVFAMALEMYSEQLTDQLKSHWRDEDETEAAPF